MPVCQEDNPNHVTESKVFCEYLGGTFYVKYSKLGIISFKCPMYVRNNLSDDIACLELLSPDCSTRERLELRIKGPI
jgi:hypothetical protein